MAYENEWTDKARIAKAMTSTEIPEDGLEARELACFALINSIIHELERSEMFAEAIEREIGDYLFPAMAKLQRGDQDLPATTPPSRLVGVLDSLRHRLEQHANRLLEIKERIQ